MSDDTIEFYWVLTFAQPSVTPVSDGKGNTYPVGSVGYFTRDGVIDVPPGQTRQGILASLVNHCREEAGVPADSLLIGYSIDRNQLAT